MLATRLTSALGLERQNQQPSTGMPLGARAPLVLTSTVSSRPMNSVPCSWHAFAAASSLSNCTKPYPCSLPAASSPHRDQKKKITPKTPAV